jgi:hypothetical protein
MSQAGAAPILGTRPSAVVVRATAQRTRLDPWTVGIFAANLAHVLVFSWAYPLHRYDPDLLAYLTYFRNWASGDATLHAMAYFTAPKLLLVFTLGALGNPTAACACTALVSALLGTVVYLIARDAFGRPTALVASFFLLLDPSKAMLTLKSSADLYLAFLVLLAVVLAERDRLIAAAICVLLSALVKPVTLPCAAYFLIASGPRGRRWTAAMIPIAAVPLILLGHQMLLGGPFRGAQFFDEFTTMTDGVPIGPGEVVHYAVWSQLIKIRFATTASWGIVGMLLWIAADRRRLMRPLLVMPLLFLSGYLALSAVAPFPPYFRYFWLLEVWFLLFLVYGALEGARRLAPAQPQLRWAVSSVVLLLLADGLIGRQLDYRRDYALPLERSMQLAGTATTVLKARRAAAETVVAPLGLLPYLMWELGDAGRQGRVDTAERIARERLAARPQWIIDLPRMYATDATRQWMAAIVRDGPYEVAADDGQGALLHRTEEVAR